MISVIIQHFHLQRTTLIEHINICLILVLDIESSLFLYPLLSRLVKGRLRSYQILVHPKK